MLTVLLKMKSDVKGQVYFYLLSNLSLSYNSNPNALYVTNYILLEKIVELIFSKSNGLIRKISDMMQ